MTGDPLRAELIRLLDGLDAHMPFEAAVADFPDSDMNRRPPNVDYSPWHLVEHLRLTQADILDYITNPDYTGRAWPDEYWPDPTATATRATWDASVAGFLADRAAIRTIVADSVATCSRSSRAPPGTRSCARSGSSPTTTPTTSASSRSCAR